MIYIYIYEKVALWVGLYYIRTCIIYVLHIHTHIYVYIYYIIHTYIYAGTHTRVLACTHSFTMPAPGHMCVRTRKLAHTYAHSYTHNHTFACFKYIFTIHFLTLLLKFVRAPMIQ